MDFYENKENLVNTILPVLPLRDAVVYPHLSVSLFVLRSSSISAVKYSFSSNKRLIIITQRSEYTDFPTKNDLYTTGTYSTILQIINFPDGSLKILVEGIKRVAILKIVKDEFIYCKFFIKKTTLNTTYIDRGAFLKLFLSSFKLLSEFNEEIDDEALTIVLRDTNLLRLIDIIVPYLSGSPIKIKQRVLDSNNLLHRSLLVAKLIILEIEILETEQNLSKKLKQQIENNQQKYYLSEQLKILKKELNIDQENDANFFLKKLETRKLPKTIFERIIKEWGKLKNTPSISQEIPIIRNHINLLLNLPWLKKTKTKRNLKLIKRKLDKNHFGLDIIKNKIIDLLFLQNKKLKIRGNILCLVGPPGTGKTSLAKSIAIATNRYYIKISLSGIKDASELHGHRKTYVGSFPGQIIQKINKVQSNNPLILLDEIDKMDYGALNNNATSPLLNILDPEQNKYFYDSYLEEEFDLSNSLFIATANNVTYLPSALLDRMELIPIEGYTDEEKFSIIKKHLIPTLVKRNYLSNKEINITNKALKKIVKEDKHELGLRNLTRKIEALVNIVIRKNLLKSRIKLSITSLSLKNYLIVEKYQKKYHKIQIGQVVGLACTKTEGEIAIIESSIIHGNGALIYTGGLGKTIKESTLIALTLLKSTKKKFFIGKNFYKKINIHVHISEGEIKKDGTSAGLPIYLSILSSIIKIPIRTGIALTGELSLKGEILPIGGLKKKILAASRKEIKTILIPHNNLKELSYIPTTILNYIKIIGVKNIAETLNYSFVF